MRGGVRAAGRGVGVRGVGCYVRQLSRALYRGAPGLALGWRVRVLVSCLRVVGGLVERGRGGWEVRGRRSALVVLVVVGCVEWRLAGRWDGPVVLLLRLVLLRSCLGPGGRTLAPRNSVVRGALRRRAVLVVLAPLSLSLLLPLLLLRRKLLAGALDGHSNAVRAVPGGGNPATGGLRAVAGIPAAQALSKELRRALDEHGRCRALGAGAAPRWQWPRRATWTLLGVPAVTAGACLLVGSGVLTAGGAAGAPRAQRVGIDDSQQGLLCGREAKPAAPHLAARLRAAAGLLLLCILLLLGVGPLLHGLSTSSCAAPPALAASIALVEASPLLVGGIKHCVRAVARAAQGGCMRAEAWSLEERGRRSAAGAERQKTIARESWSSRCCARRAVLARP